MENDDDAKDSGNFWISGRLPSSREEGGGEGRGRGGAESGDIKGVRWRSTVESSAPKALTIKVESRQGYGQNDKDFS